MHTLKKEAKLNVHQKCLLYLSHVYQPIYQHNTYNPATAFEKVYRLVHFFQEPRTEAISLLGSLICFPNLYGSMPVLQQHSYELSLITREDCKDFIVNILMRCGRKEPAGLAR